MFDVIIAGGGPTGSMPAAELHLHDLPVLVLERAVTAELAGGERDPGAGRSVGHLRDRAAPRSPPTCSPSFRPLTGRGYRFQSLTLRRRNGIGWEPVTLLRKATGRALIDA